MRKLLIAVLAFVVVATVCSAARTYLNNGVHRTPKAVAEENQRKVQLLKEQGKTFTRKFTAAAASSDPFVQPARQIIQVANYCGGPGLAQTFMLDDWGTYMDQGAFLEAPQPVIPAGATESFVAAHDPGTLNIAGQALYYFESNKTSGIMLIAFSAQKDAYEVSVSYDTKEDIALVGAVPIGKSAQYLIVAGQDPWNGLSVC
jgi:hypothetical protein